MTESVEWQGEKFAIAERIGLAPLLRFAKVAKSGTDASDIDGLVAMHDLLEQCFTDQAEFDRWLDHATAVRADADEIMEIVKQVIEVLAERPTKRPSGSPDGPSTVTPKPAPASSSELVQQRFESAGRPDLALIVANAREAQERRTA